jgi:hypothetical protein
MKFRTLQERLRKTLQARIAAGNLTGLALARQTGFRQAHICNFLNHRRGLSLEGMDRVLAVQQLSILDLLQPDEVSRHASTLAPEQGGGFENIALVDGTTAATESAVAAAKIQQTVKFKKSFLRKLRPDMETPRQHWRRFVVVKAGAQDSLSMYPRLLPGAILLIDRHYNSLRPYRRHGRNLYAVRAGGGCTIRYVELAGDSLVLRPHNERYPISLLPIEPGKSFAEYIIGRVCHIALET